MTGGQSAPLAGGMKRCQRCGSEWPADALHFKDELRNTDGLSGVCLPCLRIEGVNRKHGRHAPMRKFTEDGNAACTSCGEFKPHAAEYFGINPKCRGGLEPECRACRQAKRQARSARIKAAGCSVVGHKVCHSCGEAKDASNSFSPSTYHADGIVNVCRECDNAQKRAKRSLKFPKAADGQKYCSGCEAYLPLMAFAKRGKTVQSRCKSCSNARARAVYVPAAPRITPPVLPGLKYCGGCSEQKPADRKHFSADSLSPDGFFFWCKSCQLAHGQKWRAANPDKVRSYAATRRARAVQAGGTHTDQDIQQQFQAQDGKCYWCRSALELTGKKKFHVDHLIPLTRGGSNGPENLVCSCPGCNTSRSNKLPHEWTGRLL